MNIFQCDYNVIGKLTMNFILNGLRVFGMNSRKIKEN